MASLIDGHVADLDEHLDTLREARTRPYILDDATVGRIVRAHTQTLDDAGLFDEQLARW